ncbi:MAG: hypothetical protein ACYSWU_17010 [Planctomycetota bacterium]|jgi:hypothetical protein
MYRVAAVLDTGHEGWNSCYTDVATCNALARVVEGELRSAEDLQAAEVALQILMWHDRVDVLIPGFKYERERLRAYARADQPRSQLAFDLFAPCVPYDQMYAVERVRVDRDTVVESTLEGSTIVGRAFDQAKNDYLQMAPLQAATLAAIPLHMRVPAYFTDPAIESFTGKRGFVGSFYSTLAKQWEEALAAVPDIDAAVPLPPLLAIVLTRAGNRSTIPEAITDLRGELAPVRKQMLALNQLVQGARTQKEIEAQCKDVQESFAAALPASRHPPVSFLFPLLKLYRAAKSPLDALIKLLNPSYAPEDPRIIANRTVTGRIFSRLLATDSMHSLITHFFTDAEIQNLEASRARRDPDA